MSEELKSKALGFIRAHRAVHLATVDDGHPRVRVMEAFRTDDDFTIWFAAGKSSNKVRQIGQCPNVGVSSYADEKDLEVYGTAEVLDDEATRHEMWHEEWKRWFPGGQDDPEYCLIKVTAAKAEYRDLKETGHKARQVL
ncbi:MAG: pyridoxamine 5'-phosphate oxidase family protein [Planctomycetota bacterium]|jgi:general stress protein 26